MNKKSIIIAAASVCVIGLGIFYGLQKTQSDNTTNNHAISEKQDTKTTELGTEKNITPVKTKNKEQIKKQKEAEEIASDSDDVDNNVVKSNLYNDTDPSALPFSAIAIIPSLPKNIQNLISDITKTRNIYMIQKNKDKLLIIADNTENIRHSIEFTEISLHNGHQTKTTLGYNDKIKDSENDIWEYDQNTNQPTRHTKYNSEGDMDFVEVWNYEPDNPIKYEMKDAKGKVISLRKETLNNGTDLRIEHLLYDTNGHTRINVSTTYYGGDLKRFTYFNADKADESGSIFSEYANGQKTKETVYTSDLKLKNTYTSDYKNGNREDIIMWNNQNQEIKKFIPESL